jgi:hypothetical protein
MVQSLQLSTPARALAAKAVPSYTLLAILKPGVFDTLPLTGFEQERAT